MERIEKFIKVEKKLNICLQKKCEEFYKLKQYTNLLAEKEIKIYNEKIDLLSKKINDLQLNNVLEKDEKKKNKISKEIKKNEKKIKKNIISIFKITLKYLKKMISTTKFIYAIQCGNRTCHNELLNYVKNIEKILYSRSILKDLNEKKMENDYLKTYEKMIKIIKKELNIL